MSMSADCVGKGQYELRAGECLSSVSIEHGFFWETLWNLLENAELRTRRKDPNIVLEGDLLTIPNLRVKQESCATDARHTFQRRGTPAKLVMQFFEDGEPLAGEEYILVVDGQVRSGKLDRAGGLCERIRPNAKQVLLTIGDDEPIAVALGGLDPVTTVFGIQGRLRNLGFDPGPIDNVFGPKTKHAVQRFQESRRLDRTGQIDAALRNALLEAHGS